MFEGGGGLRTVITLSRCEHVKDRTRFSELTIHSTILFFVVHLDYP